MYSLNIIENGIAHTVYFFAAFTGHFQPYTPVDPLEFNDIHRGLVKYESAPYVQGWYHETPAGPQLYKLVKIALMKVPFKGDFESNKVPGIYYRRLDKQGGKWLAKEIITPEVVLKQDHYLRYVVDSEGNLECAWHVYSTVWDTYRYTYTADGNLKDTNITVNKVPEVIPDL